MPITADELKPGDRLICRDVINFQPETAKALLNREAIFVKFHGKSYELIDVKWQGDTKITGEGWFLNRFEKITEDKRAIQASPSNIDYMAITREIAGAGKRNI